MVKQLLGAYVAMMMIPEVLLAALIWVPTNYLLTSGRSVLRRQFPKVN